MIDAMGMPQTAVVVGGTSDIARAITRALVTQRLTDVVLVGRDEAGLQSVAKEIEASGARSSTAVFDVTEIEGHQAMVSETVARLGRIDLVLMAAGILGDQEADVTDPLGTSRVLDTNFTGPAAVLTAFASVLRRQGQGRIVVMSSVAGVRARKANYIYGASKAGLDAFAQGMADDLAGTGVEVTIVRPGWVATRMTAGRDPAPFATTPDAVAADVIMGLQKGSSVVWSPPALRYVFAVMRLLPSALWRRMPG